MSDCGHSWGYHGEHKCRLNDEHTPIYPDTAYTAGEKAVWVHLCFCGAAIETTAEGDSVNG